MSTILKTLKKLEEEKTVLDQKLDLKEMVLKEDSVYLKAVSNERNRFFLIVAMLTGILLMGGATFFYWTPNNEVQTESRLIANKIPAQQKPLPKSWSKPRTFEGVSCPITG